VSGKLARGALKALQNKFGKISKKSIERYCAEYARQEGQGILSINLDTKRKGKCGRKSKFTDEVRMAYLTIMKEFAHTWIHLTHDILREKLIEAGYTFSKSTVQNHLKLLKAHTKTVKLKPLLTDKHKENRVKFVLSQVDRRQGLNGRNLKFKENLNVIHVDESWIYLMSNDNKVLACPEIDVLLAPTVHHKSHIEKVMFLSAIARPQKRPDGTWFDGKIGIFPCTEMVATERKSKKGPRGTIVSRNKNVDSEFYYNLFSEEDGLFDTIEKMMPWLEGYTVIIQQDGARPHTGNDTVSDLEAAGTGDGWTVKVVTQPAQSPDLNINDLGFFHSLKSKIKKIKAYSTDRDEFIDLVKQAFEEYPMETLDSIWGCLYNVYREILKNDGGNQYKIPHNGGRNRAKNGLTSVDLTVDREHFERCENMFK
jgi:hypothetical protein